MKFDIEKILYEYEMMADYIVSTKRSDVYHRIIFKVDDKFYEAFYGLHYYDGLHEEGEVECKEVFPRSVTTVVYEPAQAQAKSKKAQPNATPAEVT